MSWGSGVQKDCPSPGLFPVHKHKGFSFETGSNCIAEAGLELTEIHCLCLLVLGLCATIPGSEGFSGSVNSRKRQWRAAHFDLCPCALTMVSALASP
ncbi:hypothetical protein I79_004592 [Cricetulus griseus]|uniref:Uncharacterized protein n=1 Tax=Cricetulus griseus TaxID=10029 RepID=G3H2Y7_CRIGR|nr:hypothetical protein I79_004592 [Cricetulus griseus]